MNPENYLKIKNKIPSNVNILAVSKGFKSQEIKTIQIIGQNDFGVILTYILNSLDFLTFKSFTYRKNIYI